MNKLIVFSFLIGLALVLPAFAEEEASQTEAALRFWAYKAREERAMRVRHQQQQARMHLEASKKSSIVPPWIHFKTPNAEGQKPLELEDMELWASMDLDKDGKLTIGEFERFASSPNAQRFVREMKESKAVERWAQKVGMDAEKAKAAMQLGMQQQHRRQMIANQRRHAYHAQRRRMAIMEHEQMLHQQAMMRNQAQQQAYYQSQYHGHDHHHRQRINPYLQQQYYQQQAYAQQRHRERHHEL